MLGSFCKRPAVPRQAGSSERGLRTREGPWDRDKSTKQRCPAWMLAFRRDRSPELRAAGQHLLGAITYAGR